MPAPLRPESIQCQRPRQGEQTLPLLNFMKIYSVLKVQIKGPINALGKCSTFPQNTAATLMAWQFREKQILTSCPQTLCSVAAWRCVWSSTRGPQKPLSMPTVLKVHLLQQRGKISASRWEREGWKCKGQFIIISTLAGHQDWTLNKLCQDIWSELASLAVLHKQKSAGVQHVERLPNRVINLYKQKNLPKKHISSHCTPGSKAELSCKLIHISCLLKPQRRAQATYRGEAQKPRDACSWWGATEQDGFIQ